MKSKVTTNKEHKFLAIFIFIQLYYKNFPPKLINSFCTYAVISDYDVKLPDLSIVLGSLKTTVILMSDLKWVVNHTATFLLLSILSIPQFRSFLATLLLLWTIINAVARTARWRSFRAPNLQSVGPGFDSRPWRIRMQVVRMWVNNLPKAAPECAAATCASVTKQY